MHVAVVSSSLLLLLLLLLLLRRLHACLPAYRRKPKTAAVLRTTTAVTIFNAGVKINVIPNRATAWVNHRVHPQDSLRQVLEYDRKVIGDPRVKLRVSGFGELETETADGKEAWRCAPDGRGCEFGKCGHYDGSAEAVVYGEAQWVPPSPVSSTESRGFRLLKSCVAQVRIQQPQPARTCVERCSFSFCRGRLWTGVERNG